MTSVVPLFFHEILKASVYFSGGESLLTLTLKVSDSHLQTQPHFYTDVHFDCGPRYSGRGAPTRVSTYTTY